MASSDSVSSPIVLAGNLTVTPTAGTRLTLSGGIAQSSAASLTLNGRGELILSGSNTYTGGTDVVEGTLVAMSQRDP